MGCEVCFEFYCSICLGLSFSPFNCFHNHPLTFASSPKNCGVCKKVKSDVSSCMTCVGFEVCSSCLSPQTREETKEEELTCSQCLTKVSQFTDEIFLLCFQCASKKEITKCEIKVVGQRRDKEEITAICIFSNSLFITATKIGSIAVWDINKILPHMQIKGHTATVTVLLKLNEFRFASNDAWGDTFVWDVSVPIPIERHTMFKFPLKCACVMDDKTIVGGEFCLRIIQISKKGQSFELLKFFYNPLAIEKVDDVQFAALLENGHIDIWNYLTKEIKLVITSENRIYSKLIRMDEFHLLAFIENCGVDLIVLNEETIEKYVIKAAGLQNGSKIDESKIVCFNKEGKAQIIDLFTKEIVCESAEAFNELITKIEVMEDGTIVCCMISGQILLWKLV